MFFLLGWPGLLWAIIINLLMAGWAYSDAKDRRDQYPKNWIAIVLIFGVFGLIYYLFRRPTKPQTFFRGLFCSSCGLDLSGTDKFCPRCGLRAAPSDPGSKSELMSWRC